MSVRVRWIYAIWSVVMFVGGVFSLLEGGWAGWLMIVGALLMAVSLGQLAREQRSPGP